MGTIWVGLLKNRAGYYSNGLALPALAVFSRPVVFASSEPTPNAVNEVPASVKSPEFKPINVGCGDVLGG